MSGTTGQEETGAGLVKVVTSVAGAVTAILAAVSTISDRVISISGEGHALLSTIIFALFVVYVMIDMLKWRDDGRVWIAGIAAIAVASYWWIGFLAKHGVPAEPILPARLYPPAWAYLVMAACLGAWTFWDMADALKEDYEDKRSVAAGSGALMVGIVISLFMTLRGPIGG
jgi:hypothetical protein